MAFRTLSSALFQLHDIVNPKRELANEFKILKRNVREIIPPLLCRIFLNKTEASQNSTSL